MTWWQAVVLGLVQGLTEFLPVSSSGHLVLAEAVLGLETPGVVVEVVLHVATLLAVLIVYGGVVWSLAAGAVRGDGRSRRYVLALVIGTIPAGLAGVLLSDFFERTFDALWVVGVNLVVTGAVLWSTRSAASRRGDFPAGANAFGVGVAQAFAILPGISRSGATVSAAMWLGVDPVRAAEFSFLLAVPAIGGAMVLQLPDLSSGLGQVGAGPLAVAFVVALLAGVAAIRGLLVLLRRRAFHRFAPYCLAVGVGTLVVAWRG